MQIRCPKCREASTDPDYCSECGGSITSQTATSSSVAPVSPVTASPDVSGGPCPDCGEPRPGLQSRFCDNCRYDFTLAKSYSPGGTSTPAQSPPAVLPVSTPAAVVTTVQVLPAAQPRPAIVGLLWEFVVRVDASRGQPGDPAPPSIPERLFPIDFEETLIGRRSEKDHIFPEISLTPDAGISKKHAKLTRGNDGMLTLLDLGSRNGTSVNGTEILAFVPTSLAEGDTVTLGSWTSMILRHR